MPTATPDTSSGSLASWDTTTLTKFIQDILTRNPPPFLPNVVADTLTVNEQLTVNNKVAFNGQTFTMIGGTGSPAFQNGWVNFGAPNAAACYVKGPDNFVHLHGVVSNPANPTALPSIVFTLPPGFRPESTCIYSTIGLNLIARIDITSAGTVSVVAPTTNTAPWVSLEMITFKAA